MAYNLYDTTYEKRFVYGPALKTQQEAEAKLQELKQRGFKVTPWEMRTLQNTYKGETIAKPIESANYYRIYRTAEFPVKEIRTESGTPLSGAFFIGPYGYKASSIALTPALDNPGKYYVVYKKPNTTGFSLLQDLRKPQYEQGVPEPTYPKLLVSSADELVDLLTRYYRFAPAVTQNNPTLITAGAQSNQTLTTVGGGQSSQTTGGGGTQMTTTNSLQDLQRKADELYNQLSNMQQITIPQPNLGEKVVNLRDLVSRVNSLEQLANRTIPVRQPQFQSPEGLKPYIETFQQILEPYVQAQTEQARAEHRSALEKLRNQWAARGLLASGAAAAQERSAASELAKLISAIRAEQLAKAVPWALQSGQLALAENEQIFNQQLSNWTTQANILGKALDSLYKTAELEETQRQFAEKMALERAKFELEQRKTAIENQLKALGVQAELAKALANEAVQREELAIRRYEAESADAYRKGQLELGRGQLASEDVYRRGMLDVEQKKIDYSVQKDSLDFMKSMIEQTKTLPKDVKSSTTSVIDYYQTGGAGMSLRSFISEKNGSVGYDGTNVTVTLGGKTLQFPAGKGEQYGVSFDPASGLHYVSDPKKLLDSLE